MGYRLDRLPPRMRERLLSQHPDLALPDGRRANHTQPATSPRTASTPPPPPEESSSRKSRRAPGTPRTTHRHGTLRFDSQAELACYIELTARHPAVIAHGCLPLASDAHLEPDFIIVHEVLPDGRFIGELVDAKAIWNGHRAPHLEPDWRVKAKWLRDKFHGLTIRVVTPGNTTSAATTRHQPDPTHEKEQLT